MNALPIFSAVMIILGVILFFLGRKMDKLKPKNSEEILQKAWGAAFGTVLGPVIVIIGLLLLAIHYGSK